MRTDVLPPGTDISGISTAAGVMSYTRGVQYAKRRAVLQVAWHDDARELHGLVAGRRELYQVSAHFMAVQSGLSFSHGACSCPMELNCKHVVALVLTANGSGRIVERSTTREWSIDDLLIDHFDDTTSDEAPLAIQLSIAEGKVGRPQLLAKLVRPGKTGWINGNLSWTHLASAHYMSDLDRSHVQLLHEFYAVYQSRLDNVYRYGSNDRAIDLATFESHNLWPLLDEADRAGIRLVHADKSLGDVAKYSTAEFCLDVSRQFESDVLVVRPVIRLDDSMLVEPVLFIGSDAHGLAYTVGDGSDDVGKRPIRLATLTKPVPRQLKQMALNRAQLDVPADGAGAFDERYYPRLRRMATIISSDGSYVPPEIVPPVLHLSVTYGDDHDLAFEFSWNYRIGDASFRAPLGPITPEHPYRDADLERAALAELHLEIDRLLGLTEGVVDESTRLITAGRLTGLETMRFTTELLPLLADQPGLEVDVTGEPADYREASDSLSIGLSTEASDDPDWFDLGISIVVEGRDIPLADVIAAMGRHESTLLLPDGAYISLDKPELQALRRLVEEAQALRDASGRLQVSRYQAGLWDELSSLGVVHSQAAAWKQQVSGLLEIGSVPPVTEPATLQAQLRPYQCEGFGWLSFLWEHQLGGVLADDMGLGKTLQTLALICHAKEANPGGGPFLVVAPTSVVPNWAAEAAKFAPGLRVAAITETRRRRGRCLGSVVADADVVVTSYTLFRLDFDEDYSAVPWAGLLLDEAQNVKNHQSKTYQAVRRLAAPFKLAITGTPMENNLMELWSLLSITAPGLFPSPTRFSEYYAKPIEKGQRPELLGQLRQRIRPLVKRRTKEQVAADLPAKQEQVLGVDLHPKHRTVYDRQLQRERQKVLGLIDNMDENRFTILRSLTLLRQLSLHAGLVDSDHDNVPSAKIDVLLEHVGDVVGSGHRALVFSQFTGFLGQVRARLDAESVDYCYLDGSTRDRAQVLEKFKAGMAPVFLISLKAGGFGLNLTEADYVFLLDPWWNPATESQAIDRTHRIGQTRNVMVYRMIAKDTIEEKVMALQNRKRELFASVIDDGNAFGGSLSADDIRGLFT